MSYFVAGAPNSGKNYHNKPATASSASPARRGNSFSNNGSSISSISSISSDWPSTPTLDIKNGNAFSNGASSGNSGNSSNSGGFTLESPRNTMNRPASQYRVTNSPYTDYKRMKELLDDTVGNILTQLNSNTKANPAPLVQSVLTTLEMVYEDEPTRTLRLPERNGLRNGLGYTFVRMVIDNINQIPDINRMAMFHVFQEVVADLDKLENWDPNNGPNNYTRRSRSRKGSRKQHNQRNTRRYRKCV
jgi:hypothetical protein